MQTSSKLSPVSGMVVEEARRQLRSECFNCGSRNHYANECKAPLNGCRYQCACGKYILVTSRGQTPNIAASSTEPSSSQRGLSCSSGTSAEAAAPPPQPAKGRQASSARPPSPAAKRRKIADLDQSRSGKELLLMGEAYTSLSWYLGSANPTPKQVKAAKAQCSDYALELQGCHTRALDCAGFAALPPAKPKSLTGKRTRLGTSFAECELEGVKIRRSDGELKQRLSQVLFRVVDLRRAFGS